ncbi:MAG: acid phosphatase [Conexibacter sp.]|nr:acid phosphatase [Conexibacter sp.]
MPRFLPRALAVAALLALALGAVASAASVRTTATPAQIRAGKAAYDKAITAGFAKATRQLDVQLRKHPKKPTVVLDIDETAMSNWACLDAVDFDLGGLATCVIGGKSVADPAAKAFIKHARARKVAIAFITGAPQVLCPARRTNLEAQGIKRPFTLVCRPTDTADSVVPFKSRARKALQAKGATIVVNVGDQRSDLAGGAAKTTVKLPNPIYTTA